MQSNSSCYPCTASPSVQSRTTLEYLPFQIDGFNDEVADEK